MEKKINVYRCEKCGHIYKEKELAEKCESWCREHKACNTEITKYAVKSNVWKKFLGVILISLALLIATFIFSHGSCGIWLACVFYGLLLILAAIFFILGIVLVFSH